MTSGSSDVSPSRGSGLLPRLRGGQRRLLLCVVGGAPLIASVALVTAAPLVWMQAGSLWAGAAFVVGLVAIHLLIQRRTRLEVGSLLLWRVLPAPTARRRRIRTEPFWREPGFWARASIVVLLVLAAGGPAVRLDRTDRALLIVLDSSATLAARAPAEGTRAKAMLAAARRAIDAHHGPIGLVGPGGVSLPLGSQADQLLSALDGVELPVGWRRTASLLSTAESLRQRRGGAPVDILIISDNTDRLVDHALDQSRLSAACTVGRCGVHVVGLTDPGPDTWIAQAPTQTSTGRPTRVTLARTDTAERTIELGISMLGPDGTPALERTLNVALRGGRTSVPVTLDAPGCWRLRLSAPDSLSAGDEVWVQTRGEEPPPCVIGPTDDRRTETLASWITSAGIATPSIIPSNMALIEHNVPSCGELIFLAPRSSPMLDLAWGHGHPVLGIVTPVDRPPTLAPVTHVDLSLLGHWLEPRLLDLIAVDDLGFAEPGGTGLLEVGDRVAAVEHVGTGYRRIVLGAWWQGSPPRDDEEAALGALVVLLLSRLRQAPPVVSTREGPGDSPALCPPAGLVPAASGRVYTSVTAANAGPSVAPGQVFRVPSLDPELRSTAALESRWARGIPESGSNNQPVWPWLLVVAAAWAGLEAGRRFSAGGAA